MINWKLTTAFIWIGVLILFIAGQLPAGWFILITIWAIPQLCEVWKGDN